MDIFNSLYLETAWQEFLQHKTEKQHLSATEQKELMQYIHNQRYLPILREIETPDYVPPLPVKREINKGGVSKKRIVYFYPEDFNILLKRMAFSLYKYDSLFAANCYAFRRNYGVRDAMKRILHTEGISGKYCLKVDISNYFNSIYIPMLLDKLAFLREEDPEVYRLFEKLLTADQALVEENKCEKSGKHTDKTGNRKVIVEKRGAMAGTPVAPFFANIYLMDVDWYFEKRAILYFRYSDDILIFADSLEELQEYQNILYDKIKEHLLSLNPAKVKISKPGECWEFLGFCYQDGEIDLSENTRRKIKGKIKRKAHALRRWQAKKGLSGEKAAKGFIKAMNHKFFDSGDGTEFSWSRWFFPNLTTDKGLKEIDNYMQQYIRYCVTGRHYKGNYRISYEQMKEWGYRNLVHEYYQKYSD
ncbi:MAG: reverse transcriptase domain-containing protein [Lachnospiraceae bacterium]